MLGPKPSNARHAHLRAAFALAVTSALLGVVAWAVAAPAKPHVRSTPVRKTAAAPRAAMRPNFTGTWVLDTTRSEFGKIPGGRPLARTDVIEHRDPWLRQTLFLENMGGRDTTHYRYTTDSARVVNHVDKQEIEAHVWWERNDLRLESKTKLLIFEMWLRERWSLSRDGRTLTMSRRVKYPMGEGEQKLVFSRR
jgi:hypothetical protein